MEKIFESIGKDVDAVNVYINKRFKNLTPEQGGAFTITMAGEAMVRAIVSQGWTLEFTKKFLEESIYPQAILMKSKRTQ